MWLRTLILGIAMLFYSSCGGDKTVNYSGNDKTTSDADAEAGAQKSDSEKDGTNQKKDRLKDKADKNDDPKETRSHNAPRLAKGLKVVTHTNKGPEGTFQLYTPKPEGKYPVIFFGTATMVPGKLYRVLHEYIASHGFIVVVGESTSTGQGEEMLAGINWLQGPSEFENMIAKKAFGVYGHSQGGASAFVVAGKRPDVVRSVVSIMPDCNFWVRCGGTNNVKVPVLAIAGGKDTLVPAQTVKSKVYNMAKGKAVYAEIPDMDHVSWMRQGNSTLGPAVLAWFEASLKGSKKAGSAFSNSGCDICGNGNWDIATK